MIDDLRFRSLQDWLRLCMRAQDETAGARTDGESIDEIQQAVRMLAAALEGDQDGPALINQWLSLLAGGRWRLVPVIGKRLRRTEPQ